MNESFPSIFGVFQSQENMKYLFCFNVHDLSTGFILIDITDGTLLHITLFR